MLLLRTCLHTRSCTHQQQDILVKKGVVTREQVFAAKGLDARDVSEVLRGERRHCILLCVGVCMSGCGRAGREWDERCVYLCIYLPSLHDA